MQKTFYDLTKKNDAEVIKEQLEEIIILLCGIINNGKLTGNNTG